MVHFKSSSARPTIALLEANVVSYISSRQLHKRGKRVQVAAVMHGSTYGSDGTVGMHGSDIQKYERESVSF